MRYLLPKGKDKLHKENFEKALPSKLKLEAE